MKTKLLALFVVMTLLGFFLSGCGCFQQAVEGEAPPPQATKAPPPAPKAPPEVKVMVFKETVLFDFDTADLTPQGKEEVRAYREGARAELSRADKIRVTGHTDNVGSENYNKELSLRRATAVCNYLISMAVNPYKLEVRGEGETKPVADNSTNGGRAKNRRVEVEVIGLGK
jgi:outer membrane protein OmpA-like peptidoglycan-associated protein